jgi:hypothetical protein
LVNKHFKLQARVSSSNPDGIRPVLQRMIQKGSVSEEGGEYVVKAEVEGDNAKDLNRALLSELRRAEKKTRLRAEWSADDGTTRGSSITS